MNCMRYRSTKVNLKLPFAYDIICSTMLSISNQDKDECSYLNNRESENIAFPCKIKHPVDKALQRQNSEYRMKEDIRMYQLTCCHDNDSYDYYNGNNNASSGKWCQPISKHASINASNT